MDMNETITWVVSCALVVGIFAIGDGMSDENSECVDIYSTYTLHIQYIRSLKWTICIKLDRQSWDVPHKKWWLDLTLSFCPQILRFGWEVMKTTGDTRIPDHANVAIKWQHCADVAKDGSNIHRIFSPAIPAHCGAYIKLTEENDLF